MTEKKIGRFKLFNILVSITLVLCIPFVFDLKIIDSNVLYRGFPFNWMAIYPGNGFSFKGLGFLVDVLIFYWLIKLLMNILRKNRKNT